MGGCISVVLMFITALTAGVLLAVAAFTLFLLAMLILAIVFFALYAQGKRQGARKTWQLVLGVICTAIAVLGAATLTVGYVLLGA